MDRFRFPPIEFRRVVTTAPTAHALTLPQIRLRLRLGDEDDDTDINLMLYDAELWWEAQTGQSLMAQTSELRLDRFPLWDKGICLRHAPIGSVDSVIYRNSAGVNTTWDSANYLVDLTGLGELRASADSEFPADEDASRLLSVRISMSVGYASPAVVPSDIKNALLLCIGARYVYREDILSRPMHHIPMGAMDIANRYKMQWFPTDVR